jgi:hypothetical protein
MKLNREPRNKPTTYGQLISNKSTKNKNTILRENEGKISIHKQKNEIRHLSHIMYKNQTKWVKDLNVSTETVKLQGEMLHNIVWAKTAWI